MKESLRTTMALIDKNLPVVTFEEWEFLRQVVEIFKPMEAVTKMLSAENYICNCIVSNCCGTGIDKCVRQFKKTKIFGSIVTNVTQ